jgi:hypothetical protein
MDPQQNQQPTTPEQAPNPQVITPQPVMQPNGEPQPPVMPSQPNVMNQPSFTAPSPYVPQQAPQTSPRSSKKPILIVAIIIALFSLGVGAYLLLGNNKTQTTQNGIKTTISSSANTKVSTVSSKPMSSITVASTATSGYQASGPTQSGGYSILNYIKTDTATYAISSVSYIWGAPTADNSDTASASAQAAQKLKQQYPSATVNVTSGSPISLFGSDGKQYTLPCNITNFSLSSAAPTSYKATCVVKLNNGKQILEITASSNSAADVQSLLEQFSIASKINF